MLATAPTTANLVTKLRRRTGIAVRKTEPQLKDAVSAAIDAMYADGTIKRLVDKWGLTDAVQLLK